MDNHYIKSFQHMNFHTFQDGSSCTHQHSFLLLQMVSLGLLTFRVTTYSTLAFVLDTPNIGVVGSYIYPKGVDDLITLSHGK